MSENDPIWTDDRCAAEAAEILKALAHPIRLRILAVLAHEDAHVGALAERLGAQQPIVSQQLRILRMRGLVDSTRSQGLAVYRLAEPHVRDIIACLQSCLCMRGEGHS